jgi:GntR family transcriptional repressor for pyruvate dehydrogenase complex
MLFVKIQAINRPNLSTIIAAQLRDMVLNGELKPGDQLPGHRDLARRFGVSITAVREAISALMAAGVLQTHPGRGTFVSRSPRLDVESFTSLGTPTDQAEMRELVEARMVLERALVGLAARRATPEHVEALRRLVADMRGHLTDPEEYLAADVGFHMAVAVAAQNRVLRRAMFATRTLLKRELQLNTERGLDRYGDLAYSVVSHEQLVEAIAARDPDAADAIIEEIVARAAGYLDDERQPGESASEPTPGACARPVPTPTPPA